jgi:hypothetical protein
MPTVESAVRNAIVKGVTRAAIDPLLSTEQSDVGAVTSKVLTEVAPIVAHATNSEPWYQSRVTLGALLAAIAGILGLFGYAFPEEVQGKVIDLVLASTPLIGAALTLYGRWFAKRPLGN